nr:DUF2514 family protein [Pseudomonas sp. UBA6718]
MTWLKLVPAWAWWLLALVLVAGGQQVRVYSAQTDLANYRAEVSERDRRAAMAVLAENQRRQKAADESRREALEQIEQAQADAAAAGATADGLRGEADRLKRKLASCAGTVAGSAPGRDAGSVLADLLAEVEREGRAMAAEAQRRGIAGAACERQYDAQSASKTTER